ncbi:hypothetical protein [Spirosoma flavum]|uniref:DUF3575 domain-containing protein n=1 Tax=Spirosoma flavum TaxID=2048557 RepID=A0ABW6APY5_9BACT
MKTRYLILLSLLSFSLQAQQKSYDIAISYGRYVTPILYQSQVKTYLSADFEYHLTNRWSISSGLMKGTFGYYDGFPTKRSNGTYMEVPNSEGADYQGYVLAKYALVANPRFRLQLGAGVGYYVQHLSFACESNLYESTNADVSLPISIEGYYFVIRGVGLGIKAGCYVQPAIWGIHIGPQIRIRL